MIAPNETSYNICVLRAIELPSFGSIVMGSSSLLTIIIFSLSTRAFTPHYSLGCWCYLERLEAVHAAAAAAPHEAEPLDPVVGGHGGVPDPVPPGSEAVQAADQQEDQAAPAERGER